MALPCNAIQSNPKYSAFSQLNFNIQTELQESNSLNLNNFVQKNIASLLAYPRTLVELGFDGYTPFFEIMIDRSLIVWDAIHFPRPDIVGHAYIYVSKVEVISTSETGDEI